MDKNTQKKKRHNSLVIKKLAEKFGYTERYVRGCINKEFDGVMPDEIRSDYKTMEKAIEETVIKVQTSKK